jgi:8-oxo-dGTP pyrophosphatase MutT (NUDIX family)
MWAPPGGGKEHGETPEEAAVRELHEETGLVPSSALTLVAIATPTFYGMDYIHCFYACEAATGDVVLNDEHDAFRWVDPIANRDRAYSEEREDAIRTTAGYKTWLQFRDAYDRYLAWHRHQAVCTVVEDARASRS